MIVMKFGGTSVKDAPAIRRLIDIVTSRHNHKTLVVVSALAGVTNELVKIIDSIENGPHLIEALQIIEAQSERHMKLISELELTEFTRNHIQENYKKLENLVKALSILGEVGPRSRAAILSFGELNSSFIVTEAFKQRNHKTAFVDARRILKTDSDFLKGNVDWARTEKETNEICAKAFEQHDYIVTGGFIGSDAKDITTTLGRGGSDYSGSVLGSVLNAKRIEIWTDVDGVLTADPRLIPNAKRILKMSFQEASELAYFGAKVLHPATIHPAVAKNIPVWIYNSMNPEHSGTEITESCPTLATNSATDKHIIKAVSYRKHNTLINIHSNRMLGSFGFLHSVFKIFQENKTSVDLISTSEVNILLTIDDTSKLPEITEELSKISQVSIKREMAIVSAVGSGIRNTAGIAARFFKALEGVTIEMITFGGSDVNLAIVVSSEDAEKAVKLLHEEFCTKDLNPHVFAV